MPNPEIKNWPALLSNSLSKVPSNALLINDRYFFTDEMDNFCNKISIKGNGIYNLKGLLKSLLPSKESRKSGRFDILIVFSAEAIKENDKSRRKETVSIFFDKLKTQIKEISDDPYLSDRCPYCINLIMTDNIMTYNDKKEFKDITHNRAIYSNYYMITADHALSAFSNSKGCRCSQNVYISKLFTDALKPFPKDCKTPLHVAPLYGHDYYVAAFRIAIRKLIDNKNVYPYPEEMQDEINRLFVE